MSVRAAQNDASVTVLTSVRWSDILNLPVAISVSVILAGLATINSLVVVPTMGFLAFASLVFVVFTRTHLRLTDREAVGFVGLYVLFLLWVTLETVDVVETVRGI